MSEQEEKWLEETFPSHRGKTLRRETLSVYYEAERLLKNKESITKRTCSCQYRSMAEGVHVLYDKWNAERKKR